MRTSIIAFVLSGFMAASSFADDLQLQDNPPDRYVVVKGDTLWDISGRFLKEPWRWPEIWNMNREEIKNPHLIYPGDVVVLDRSGASPKLRLVKGVKVSPKEGTTVKLSPRIRVEAGPETAIPTIPANAIEPFLSQPLVIEPDGLDHSPQIVATEEGRVVVGAGNIAYVDHLPPDEGVLWQVYRPGKALIDPDTKETLGHEAVYLGDARAVAFGTPSVVEITSSKLEINRGDRLVRAPEEGFNKFIPHAPDKPVRAQIISAYGSVDGIGQYAIVTLNKGSRDGLEKGDVLAIYHKGETVKALPKDTGPGYRYSDTATVKEGKSISFDKFYDPAETLNTKEKPAEGAETVRYVDIGCLKSGEKVSYNEFFDPRKVYRLNCRPNVAGTVSLPDERAGLAIVFRTFDRVSYALVLKATRALYLLDVMQNP
jgi:hypothetical protein